LRIKFEVQNQNRTSRNPGTCLRSILPCKIRSYWRCLCWRQRRHCWQLPSSHFAGEKSETVKTTTGEYSHRPSWGNKHLVVG